MDGPVVLAARRALEARDVTIVLPYVKKDGEAEVQAAFERAVAAHDGNPIAGEVADLWFSETVVRVHRAGEGAPYTGLKPAGLGFGPVIPVAERAIESGSVDELERLLVDKVRHEVRERFMRMMTLQAHAGDAVDAAREYVEAMLGIQLWSHGLYMAASGGGHSDGASAHEHGD
jgi:hypothetical protein